MYHKNNGFTLIELGVTLASLVIVLVLFTGCGLFGARENARQAVCASNLKALSSGINTYQMDNRDKAPHFSKINGDKANYSADPVQVTSTYDKMHEGIVNFYEKNSNCSLQAWYLLIQRGCVQAKHFQCPSDANYIAPDLSKGKLGFSSWNNSSFGLQVAAGKWHSSMKNFARQEPSTVIAGDKPVVSGGKIDASKPNANHGENKINLLAAGGKVLEKTWDEGNGQYNNFGYKGDDVYSCENPTSTMQNRKATARNAASPNDSYLFTK